MERSKKIYYIKTDIGCKYTYANAHFIEKFGLSPNNYMGKDALANIHFEDLHLLIKAINNLKTAKSTTETLELRMPNKSGIFFYTYWEFNIDYNQQNTANGFTFIGFDITNTKKLEFENLDAKYILNKSQELAGLGTFTYDVGNKKLTWSEESYKIYNTDPTTEISLPYVFTKVHPEDLHLCDYKLLDKLLHTKSTIIVNNRLLDNTVEGGIRYLEGIYEYYYNDVSNKEYIIGAVLDISKLKKKENELSNIIKHLNSILDNNDLAIGVINREYKLISFNAESIKIANLIGLKISAGQSILDYIPEKSIKKVKADYANAFSGKRVLVDAPIYYESGHFINDIYYYPIYNQKNVVEFIVINCKFNEPNKQIEITKKDTTLVAKSIIDFQELEKDRIATDLHDSVNQLLYIAKIHLSNVPEHTSKAKASELIERATDEIKQIINNSSKFLLDNTSLEDAIEEYLGIVLGTSQVEYNISISNKFKINIAEDLKLVIFRITQEITQNVCKHAKATTFNIKIKYYQNFITIILGDNGIGFEYCKVAKGKGLDNIKNRTIFVKGKLKMISAPQKGTIFIINIPIYI